MELGIVCHWREEYYLPGGWSLRLAGGSQKCFLYCYVCFPCGPSNYGRIEIGIGIVKNKLRRIGIVIGIIFKCFIFGGLFKG